MDLQMRITYEWIITCFGCAGILASQFSGSTYGIQEGLAKAAVASIDLHLTCGLYLLPSPLKSHYVFNYRAIFAVVQGIMQANHKTVYNTSLLARLWAHETMRVFGDRLVATKDVAWLKRSVANLSEMYFKEDLAEIDTIQFGNFTFGGLESYSLVENPDEQVGSLLPRAVLRNRFRILIFVRVVFQDECASQFIKNMLL